MIRWIKTAMTKGTSIKLFESKKSVTNSNQLKIQFSDEYISIKDYPVRDLSSVEKQDNTDASHAFRYADKLNHVAYLRHARFRWESSFYRASIPNGMLDNMFFKRIFDNPVRDLSSVEKQDTTNVSHAVRYADKHNK